MLLNGLPSDHISLSDRGLHYGDGLFETLAVVAGRPLLWERHMARLARGEAVLGLPATDRSRLLEEAESLCRGVGRGVLKIILTRGSGGRGYQPPEPCEPNRILSLHPWPELPEVWYRQGMRVRICDMRWSRNRRLAGLKHLNRLEQVLARREWTDPGIGEGLMLDEQGHVISGTRSNLFLLNPEGLVTPDLGFSGVAGVMRELVIETASRLALPLEVRSLGPQDLAGADALFVSNTVMGLCPVSWLAERRYAPEALSGELRAALSALRGGLP